MKLLHQHSLSGTLWRELTHGAALHTRPLWRRLPKPPRLDVSGGAELSEITQAFTSLDTYLELIRVWSNDPRICLIMDHIHQLCPFPSLDLLAPSLEPLSHTPVLLNILHGSIEPLHGFQESRSIAPIGCEGFPDRIADSLGHSWCSRRRGRRRWCARRRCREGGRARRLEAGCGGTLEIKRVGQGAENVSVRSRDVDCSSGEHPRSWTALDSHSRICCITVRSSRSGANSLAAVGVKR
jgi:hypothetical protein